LSVHLGLKPLKCNISDCTASFAFASQLSSHKAKHLIAKLDRLDFRSLKAFIMLFLEVYPFISEPISTSSESQYIVTDATLPEINIKRQDQIVVLPPISTLENFKLNLIR
jgi:hypothetical protein